MISQSKNERFYIVDFGQLCEIPISVCEIVFQN